MCGICGIFCLDSKPIEKELIKKMCETMIHRGPDGEGIFLKGSIGLGHRRLSIIDLTTGDQPMGNDDGTVQVVFNGEIYNFIELKRELEKKGHCFRTRSDTETLIYSYLEWGESFVEKLRGMFAIALWDARLRKLVLVRDRIGKKPLYYCFAKNTFLFASEMKAILAYPNIPKVMDLQALDAYMSFGYVPSPMSIFKHIRKLPPAHVAVVSETDFKIFKYWTLNVQHDEPIASEEKAVEELSEIFDEAVKIRLISDVPLGAFLSGGVDSSAVVAAMANIIKPDPVKTTSIGFTERIFDELEYARIIAKQYQTDHAEYIVNPDALNIIEKLVWHFDEPFADASAIPTYYVSKMARERVTVAVSGDGGDENFAGYVQRYSMSRFEDGIRKKLPKLVRRNMLGPLSRVYPKADFLPRPFRLKRFLSNLSCSVEKAYFRDMSFYFAPEMKRKLYRQEFFEELDGFNAYSILGSHFANYQNPDITTRVQYIDIMTYLPEDILVKVDRMSMANSLEVRSPILDHKLMEFVWRLPSSLKLRGKVSKYIFKKMNTGRLPEVILNRKKQGFCVPLAAWLRGDLKPLAIDLLFSNNSGLSQYFNGAHINDIWGRHQAGIQDNSASLWGLIMFELWQRRYR